LYVIVLSQEISNITIIDECKLNSNSTLKTLILQLGESQTCDFILLQSDNSSYSSHASDDDIDFSVCLRNQMNNPIISKDCMTKNLSMFLTTVIYIFSVELSQLEIFQIGFAKKLIRPMHLIKN